LHAMTSDPCAHVLRMTLAIALSASGASCGSKTGLGVAGSGAPERGDAATADDAMTEAAAEACSCRVCEESGLGARVGCKDGELCSWDEVTDRPICVLVKPTSAGCPQGTEQRTPLDCDAPVDVCVASR